MSGSLQAFVRTVFERHLIWALLVVLGLFFVLLTGSLDLSLESTFALAPTLAIMIVLNWLPDLVWPGLTMPIVLVIGLLAGMVNGFISVRLGVNAFLVTLATLLVYRGIVIFLIPEGIYYLPIEMTFWGESRVLGFLPIAVIIWFVLYGLAFALINYHRLGKNIFALGNNPEAAFIAGVDVDRTRITCFCIAGVLAALGGLLELGRLQSAVADLGQGDILMAFAGAILGGTGLAGGVGSVGGIFAAVLVISIIENLMNLFGVEPSVRQIVFGLILLAAIYLTSLQGRVRVRAA